MLHLRGKVREHWRALSGKVEVLAHHLWILREQLAHAKGTILSIWKEKMIIFCRETRHRALSAEKRTELEIFERLTSIPTSEISFLPI